MTEQNHRDFIGIWVPAEIYEAPNVPWTAKILFCEIHSFTKNGRECYMSNKYLSELLQISETQVSKHISLLIEKKWIRQTSFDGRKRYLQSCLEVKFKSELNNNSSQTGEKGQVTLEQNFNHNNKINSTNKREEALSPTLNINSRTQPFPKHQKNTTTEGSPGWLEREKKFKEKVFETMDTNEDLWTVNAYLTEKDVRESVYAFIDRYTEASTEDPSKMLFEVGKSWGYRSQLKAWLKREDPNKRKQDSTPSKPIFVLGEKHNAAR